MVKTLNKFNEGLYTQFDLRLTTVETPNNTAVTMYLKPPTEDSLYPITRIGAYDPATNSLQVVVEVERPSRFFGQTTSVVTVGYAPIMEGATGKGCLVTPYEFYVEADFDTAMKALVAHLRTQKKALEGCRKGCTKSEVDDTVVERFLRNISDISNEIVNLAENKYGKKL